MPANGFGIPVNPENPDGDWDTFTGFGLSFDVTYPWLMTEGSKEFEANRAGDSKTFQFSSYYVPDAYEVEGEGLDEWYTVTVGEIDPNTYLTPVTIEVDPFTGEDARVAAVNFTVPGSKETIWVAQHSASSVDNVAASATKAAVEGGNFVVESANATAVAVYNVAGQKVASAAIEGKTVIPAADLANGMYILKFNDNTVVKVVK